MEASLRLGVGLDLSASGLTLAEVTDLAYGLSASGWGTLWLAGRPDPCTLAGAISAFPSPDLLGVVEETPGGRHPAVLARDLSGLDVLTAGRAAVFLRWSPRVTVGPASIDCLAESAEVFRAVCRGAVPVETRHFHVEHAVNRPGPVRLGGPPVLVELPTGWTGSLERLAGTVDALVVGGDPDDVAAMGQPATIWRADAASRGSDEATAARAAGASGLIVKLPVPTGRPRLDVLADLDRWRAAWGD